MKDRLKILIVIGVVVGVFSAIIPFARIFSETIENRIYFRGILLGFILVCTGSAAVLQGYYKGIVISVGCGAISLLIASTLNLIYTELIKTENYFFWTIYVCGGSLLIMILIKAFGVYVIKLYYVIFKKYKACWNKLYLGYRLLKEL
jgi:peptidoglycan/LPS O-acetylase OafA/YrhL